MGDKCHYFVKLFNQIINAIMIITNSHAVTSNSYRVNTTNRVLLDKQMLSLNETDLDN